MTTCQSCTHWKPRDNPAWAKLGFAPCALGSRHNFKSPHRPACERHVQAAAEIVAKRKAMKGANK